MIDTADTRIVGLLYTTRTSAPMCAPAMVTLRDVLTEKAFTR